MMNKIYLTGNPHMWVNDQTGYAYQIQITIYLPCWWRGWGPDLSDCHMDKGVRGGWGIKDGCSVVPYPVSTPGLFQILKKKKLQRPGINVIGKI